jgi:hypothetical protein
MMPKAECNAARSRPPTSGDVATGTWQHSRRYAVYMGNTLLGTSNLESPAVPGARIAGWFVPTPACAHITWVFQLYSKAVAREDRALLQEYVTERDKLRLELWIAGIRLEGVVELISTWSDALHVVHVASADTRLWRPLLYPD